jgi:hypothetical protein
MADSTHRVKVVRIPEIEKHPNADLLGLVHLGGFQLVVKLGEFKPGDLAVFVQPDSVVPERDEFKFLWEGRTSPVPDKYRRVTVRRFRKEWSEGLLLPYDLFFGPGKIIDVDDWKAFNVPGDGDDVSELLGITHYEPPEPGEVQRREQYKGWPRSLRGWFYLIARKLGLDLNWPTGGENERGPKNPPPVYDVEALKNFMNAFEPGEEVIVTEKIHGSNMRCLFDGKKFYVGSRKLWKSEKSDSVWRLAVRQNPWIEQWCRNHPNYTLYGEVVPTQSLTYGYTKDSPGFLTFDVLSPTGVWVSPFGYTDIESCVPLVASGGYEFESMTRLADGPSLVPGSKNLREGIVIRAVRNRTIRGLGRLQLKVVSNTFLISDKGV